MSTIVALATPPGIGAIHVIRLSGSKAFEIINKISKNFVAKDSNRIQLNYLKSRNSQLIDQVLLMKFYAPNSYTGEDLIEINCHGSTLVVKLIIDELIKQGAIYALPGEFTQRAFLNNKIDLNQAMNINYLFQAKSENELYAAVKNIEGELSRRIQEIFNLLLDCIGICEVNIDYPPELDDDINEVQKNLYSKIKNIIEKIESLIHDSENYKPSSYRVVFVGKPNVGKSSLLNSLLKRERVIVSEFAGTTRDSVEIEYFLDGLLLTLVDTAGIRNNPDPLEYEGIKKTKEEIEKADLIVYLISIEDINSEKNEEILSYFKNKKIITIFTKSDLIDKDIPCNSISVKKNNLSFLINTLKTHLQKSYVPIGISSQEGIGLLKNALDHLALSLSPQLPIDLIAENLTSSLHHITSLSSKPIDTSSQNLFSKFCVGK